MKPRVIWCAGMHRSGSTWLYNVVRLGLGRATPVFACFGHEAVADAQDEPVWVVKTHTLSPRLPDPDLVVMTYRDLRSVAASALARGVVDGSELGPWLATVVGGEWDDWRSIEALRVRYESVAASEVTQAWRVLSYVGSNADPCEIAREVAALRGPETEHDPLTQLHPGHRTGVDWRTYLSGKQVRMIEDRFGDWLREHGYL